MEAIEVTPNTVPQDYANLGVQGLGYNPPPPERLRLVLQGPYSQGKSVFVSSSAKTMVLDFEGGAGGIIGRRANPLIPKDYGHLMLIKNKLIEDAKTGMRYFDRVVFDSADKAADLIGAQIAVEKSDKKVYEHISEYGSEGRGWFLLRARLCNLLDELYRAGYGWTVTTHLKQIERVDLVTGETVKGIGPSLFPSLASDLIMSADMYLTIYRGTDTIVEKGASQEIDLGNGEKVIVEGTNQTITKHAYFLDCRGRTGEGKKRGVPDMPDKFEVPKIGGWDVFVKQYNKAVESGRKEQESNGK